MSNRTRPMQTAEAVRYVRILAEAPEREAAYAAMAALAIGTGARIGEVLAMRTMDVLEPDGRIREQVRRKLLKKRNVTIYREAHFTDPVLREIVRRYADSPRRPSLYLGGSAPFFAVGISGRALHYKTAWHHNRHFLQLAGLPLRGIGFHGLRKTFLSKVYSRVYRGSGDMMQALTFAQKLAGHNSINTTIRYLDISPVDEEDTVREVMSEITGGEES